MTYGSGPPLVADTSAWARSDHPEVGDRWRATRRAKMLVSCPVVVVEFLAVARTREEHERIERLLAVLPEAPVTRGVGAAAITASRELAPNHRGIPVADYLIGAAAAARGFGVLHYDGHFDRLAPVLGFESVWIAAPGSL